MKIVAVEPVSRQKQETVIECTQQYIDMAKSLFGRSFDPIEIAFDLKGKTAGMYRVRHGKRLIRYNPFLFAKYFDDNLANTVPHEVAHYVADVLFGFNRIRPHGVEWKNIMDRFGAEPIRTCTYNMDGIPTRQFRMFSYKCDCSVHQLTSRRHNQIQRKRKIYVCQKCRQSLISQN